MVTRGHAFGPTAMTADTETTVGSAYKVPTAGTIKRIRVAFYQGVIDKATSGILYIKTDQQKGPFEFAIGGVNCIATTSGSSGSIPTEEIECAISVKAQEEVTVSCKMAEAQEEMTVSILWE